MSNLFFTTGPARPAYQERRSIFAPSGVTWSTLEERNPVLYKRLSTEDYESDHWTHGLCDPWHDAPNGQMACFTRNCSPSCCCVVLLCEPVGPCCAWASMGAAVGLPSNDQIFVNLGIAGQIAQAGEGFMQSKSEVGKGIGLAIYTLGVLLYWYVRAKGRRELSRWLGMGHRKGEPSPLPESFLMSCFAVACCAPCATLQEVDAMAQAYIQIRRGPRGKFFEQQGIDKVDVVYAFAPCSFNGPPGLCCFLEEEVTYMDGSITREALKPLPPPLVRRDAAMARPFNGLGAVSGPACMAIDRDGGDRLPLLALSGADLGR